MEVYGLVLPDRLYTRKVNAFLIKNEPITLIDTGPNTQQAFDALARNLKKAQVTFKDIKRIIITHSHLDHAGLVQKVKEQSGALVFASEKIRSWIENYHAEWNREILKVMNFLDNYSVPRSYISTVVMAVWRYKKFGAASKIDKALDQGHIIEFEDAELKVVNNPGHSMWCISLFEPTEKILFCGDLLMENPTSNPLMQTTPEDPKDWPNQIELIRNSLETVCSLEPKLAFPGHGEPIASIPEASEKILQKFQHKQNRILEALGEGMQTLFQINRKVSKFKTPVEQFMEIFETIHHLNCLISRRMVKQKGPGFSLL